MGASWRHVEQKPSSTGPSCELTWAALIPSKLRMTFVLSINIQSTGRPSHLLVFFLLGPWFCYSSQAHLAVHLPTCPRPPSTVHIPLPRCILRRLALECRRQNVRLGFLLAALDCIQTISSLVWLHIIVVVSPYQPAPRASRPFTPTLPLPSPAAATGDKSRPGPTTTTPGARPTKSEKRDCPGRTTTLSFVHAFCTWPIWSTLLCLAVIVRSIIRDRCPPPAGAWRAHLNRRS